MKKVFFVCSGVGHINRGYETFTREIYDTLKDNQSFELRLFKGAGKSNAKEKPLFIIKRNSLLSKFLTKFIFRNNTYRLEQFTFLISLLPYILFIRPQVVFYSDYILGCWLYHLRRLLNLKYILLFSNGAPNGPPFKACDYVQQLLPLYKKKALLYGEPAEKHFLVPYGISIEKERMAPDKMLLRKELKLPLDKKIILSVGSINSSHKRMDYLIDEVSVLNDDFFLVMVGQKDEESPEIESLAQKKLKGRHSIHTVPKEKVVSYYNASDFFVLASLNEGLPRVILEAASTGLPVLVHNYGVTQETLGKYGVYADFTIKGAVTDLIQSLDSETSNKELEKFIYENYSWDKLKGEYVKMFEEILMVKSPV